MSLHSASLRIGALPPTRRNPRRPVVTAIRIFTLAALVPLTAHAQHVQPDYWTTDGHVSSLARSGSTLFVGGSFMRLAPYSGPCAAYRDGTVDPLAGFPNVRTVDGTGQVVAVASDGLGGWFIGGVFDSVGGLPRHNLAHILSSEAVDAWNPGADSAVTCLAVSGASGDDY